MYTQETLAQLNPAYTQKYRVTPSDVEKVNDLIERIEAKRRLNTSQPLDGDRIVCISPKKGVVAEYGHAQARHSFSDYLTVCTQPYTPFIDKSLRSDASGGYWVSLERKDMEAAKLVGRAKKLFCTWGHNGPCAGGAIDFEAEVFVWEVTLPSFY